MGLLLFGLVFGFLALAHADLPFQSTFLLGVGLVMLLGCAALCKLYFFRSPLIGVSLALVCYMAAIVTSRVNPSAG